ncbi:MAG: hypothetical protein U1E93_11075 [Alphaproteobacteria bacterium]
MSYRTAVIVIAGLSAAPALADTTRDEVLAGVARCGVIHDDKVWLDCVYGAQQPMRAKLGLTPAPELQQRLVPGVATVPPPSPVTATVSAKPGKKRGFFDRLLLTEMDNAPHMKEYHFERNGAFVVTLENGEQYRQADVESAQVNWNRPPSSYRVLVTQGVFGSYNLRTDQNPHIYRVKPVK